MKVINRVKKYEDFQKVIHEGKLVKSTSLTLYFLEDNYGYTRVGISIPTKSGSAVVRNKMKRQIRAIIGQELDYQSLSLDLVLIARRNYDIGNFTKTRADIIELINKARNK